MSYTQVFGGTTIYPSDVSYLAVTLNADKALEWPLESNDPSNPAARVIDVTTTGAHSIVLPDATQTGAGQTILFNNLSPSTNSFTLKDYSGATIATIDIGEQWQVYLADTATAAGTWRVFQYGASTATVQPSALAGYGLTVTSNVLSQSLPVTTFTNSPRTVLVTDRASALVWSGTGAGTLNLPSAAVVGNNFFIGARNSGGGDLTIAAAGSETIDGDATLVLRPGESANLITDGLEWYTLGLGQEAVFAFDYTSITVTGGTYTLAGSELNRIAYKFVGTLTADQYVVVPSTVQQYWIDNATTGAYSFYLQTTGGTPVGVGQGTRGIYYCDGSNVVDADTASISLPVAVTDGGTGITNYTTGDLLYANTATSLARLSDVAVGNALISGGVGVSPSWGKVGLSTHVSGTLPVANGGTGATDAATARSNLGAGTVTSVGGTGTVNGISLSGTVTGSGSLTLGGTLSGVNLATQVTGTLPVANGGTGQSSYTDGQLLIGNSSGNTLTKSTLTAGTGITISNGNGSITISNSGATGTVTSVSGTGTVNGITLTGTVTSSGSLTLGGTLSGVSLTTQVTGTLPIANGGTGATSAAAALTALGAYPASNPNGYTSNAGTVTSVSGTGTVNGITLTGTVSSSGSLTLGGSLSGVSLTSQVSGTLPVANGGTGTATAFTSGSVVFAGASGVYSQDNANLFWDDSNNRLGVGTTSPGSTITAAGTIESTSGGFKFPDATTQTTAAGSLTQIDTYTVSGTPATIDFTNLSQSYNHLLIEITNASHNHTSSTLLRMYISSDNGSTYSASGLLVTEPGVAAASGSYSSVNVMQYKRQTPLLLVSLGGTGSTTNISNFIGAGARASSAINAVRFDWDSGNFDGGTITVYGYN